MNTKALRQKILDLAIRGKLVPQDPNDEPASVLLDRIRAEKERLIAEGKIKRPKSKTSSSASPYQHLPPPFDIPDSWVWTNIGELLENRDAERVPVSSAIRKKQTNKIYDYYGAAGVIDKVDDYLFDERLLLIGEDGANLLSRVKDNAFFAEGKFWVNNHAHILDCKIKSILDYVAVVVNSYNLEPFITGSAQPKLSQDNLNAIPIPLPPLEEQNRILSAIQMAMVAVIQLNIDKAELAATVLLAKSKILELAMQGKLVPQDPADEPATDMLRRINPKAKILTDIPHYYPIPNTWIFGNLSSVTSIKSAKRIMKSDWSESGVPFYRTREIVKLSRDGYVNNELFISHELYKELKEKYGVPSEADIMLTAVGTIGATYIVKHNDLFYYKDASVLCIHPSIALYSKYLSILFSCSLVQKQMKNNSKGTTVDTITIEKAGNYIFPLPPLNEQKRIVAKIEELFQVLDSIEASLQS